MKANFLALMRAVARGLPLPLAGIENRRSLIYVGNLCDAILACLDAPDKTYLLSDGAPVSTPQLCVALGQALGRPARLFRFPAFIPGPLKSCLEVDVGAAHGARPAAVLVRGRTEAHGGLVPQR